MRMVSVTTRLESWMLQDTQKGRQQGRSPSHALGERINPKCFPTSSKASLSRSASERCENRAGLREHSWRLFSVSCSVDPAAGSHTPENAVNQTRNTKLRGHKSFNGSNLTDIHSKDAGPVGERRDEIQRVIPPETSGLRGA